MGTPYTPKLCSKLWGNWGFKCFLHHGFCFLPFQHFQTKPNKGPDHQVNLRKVHDKVHDSLRTCKSKILKVSTKIIYDIHIIMFKSVQTRSNLLKQDASEGVPQHDALTMWPRGHHAHRWGAILRIQNAQIRMVANHMRLEVQSSYVGVVKLSCIWRQAGFLVRSAQLSQLSFSVCRCL